MRGLDLESGVEDRNRIDKILAIKQFIFHSHGNHDDLHFGPALKRTRQQFS